jgi:hypothetical protein
MASKQLLLKIKVARIGVALSVWRRKLMRKNCELCGFDLAGEGIKDLIPLCHTCYVDKNPQVIKYLAELKELGKDNV